MSSDVQALKDVDRTAGEDAVASVQESLDAIATDLESAKSDASAELSEPIATFEASVNDLSSAFDTAKADGSLSADEATGLADAVAGVSTSWDALKEAAPDCDL